MKEKNSYLFRNTAFGLASLTLAGLITGAQTDSVEAQALVSHSVVINEVESDDPNSGNDWVEIYNRGEEAIDLSGWIILDDKGEERITEEKAWYVMDGTVINPGEFFVFEETIDFDFGLGKNDHIQIFDSNQALVAEFSYSGGHASGTYGRREDGVGEMIDLPVATKNTSNSSISETDSGVTVYLNEIESDNPSGEDWVEIYNYGTKPVDISGWGILDDKGTERLDENGVNRLVEGTILQPGEYFVFDYDVHFSFGLGKGDTVTLIDADNNVIDEHTYPSRHAMGTFGRLPGSPAQWVDLAEGTRGTENVSEISEEKAAFEVAPAKGAFLINEIDSNPSDWVEFVNTTDKELDVSGFEFRDDSDDHRFKFAEGTTVAANGLIVVDESTKGLVYDNITGYTSGTFNFGIGSNDEIRLYNPAGELIDSFGWTTGHASYEGNPAKATWGRMPNGSGKFYLSNPTKGIDNVRYNPSIAVNEVESDDPIDGPDWVEVYNYGEFPVDISCWQMADEDGAKRISEGKTTPVAEGTILYPGDFYVFEENKDFDFGLGKGDSAILFDEIGNIIDQYTWPDNHANGTYGRLPNGTGDWIDMANASKGNRNHLGSPVLINEIESKDDNDGLDWVEFYNPTSEALDISGLILKDNKDENAYILPENTILEANGYLVLTEDDFGFGLGGTDSVRLFDGDELIQEFSWEDHADVTFGRRPDIDQKFGQTNKATPGTRNSFADIPNMIDWPGSTTVEPVDKESFFLEDSSGLDFHDGSLYAVDNGTGIFWKLNMDSNGNLTVAPGFETGKKIVFQKDADHLEAAGPDTEGITVDGNGSVYVAAERDNSAKDVNYNVILQVDPTIEGNRLVALNEWDLTASLPQVSANMGIEAVEWVANEDVADLLFDENTGEAFEPANYPHATANGVFFVALEDNGHVYAYVLNNDGTVQQIADIDSRIGGAMGLDYDQTTNTLWVESDNGYAGKLALVKFNGTAQPDITHVARPVGLDNENHEGFAIAGPEFAQDGMRPVFWFTDGMAVNSLKQGGLAYVSPVVPEAPEELETPTIPEQTGNNQAGQVDNDGQLSNEPNQKDGSQEESTSTDTSTSDKEETDLPTTGESSNAIFAVVGSIVLVTGVGLKGYTRKSEEVL